MSFSSKHLLTSFLAFVGLSVCFSQLFTSIWIGVIIGLFLSLCIFYDPKKYESSKRKFEEREKNNKNNLNV